MIQKCRNIFNCKRTYCETFPFHIQHICTNWNSWFCWFNNEQSVSILQSKIFLILMMFSFPHHHLFFFFLISQREIDYVSQYSHETSRIRVTMSSNANSKFRSIWLIKLFFVARCWRTSGMYGRRSTNEDAFFGVVLLMLI